MKVVELVQPQYFIMENVPNLLSLAGGIVRDAIIDDFTSLGYKVIYKILTASDYGTPQNRRRVFFVGLREATKQYEFPKPTFGIEKQI